VLRTTLDLKGDKMVENVLNMKVKENTEAENKQKDVKNILDSVWHRGRRNKRRN